MRIEVAVPPEKTTKDKGDLLENIAAELLRAMNYQVTPQVRRTASEIDLHCVHNVSGTTIYVECKAKRDPLSSNVLTNLLGKLTYHKDYSAVWLVSAGPLGKDAKGFQIDWESRSKDESSGLKIYTPERVIDALISNRIIEPLPSDYHSTLKIPKENLGEPFLLITPFGRHWIIPILSSGVPLISVAFCASSRESISDLALIANIQKTDFTMKSLGLQPIPVQPPLASIPSDFSLPDVVQVSTGENWKDYRPARPEDFVGRIDTQKGILDLFGNIRNREALTRVLAITGNSGMGKSSLIAKLRHKVGNKFYRRKYFIFAVDVRAATSNLYILSALIEALTLAIKHFDISIEEKLRVSDVTAPLSDPSIQKTIKALSQGNHVVCLIFDQFEELYSKPELSPLFDTVLTLMKSVISSTGPIVLGFAWKSDAVVHQEHPAYHMWHQLSDHRFKVNLEPLSTLEAKKAVNIFQHELGKDLKPELHRQLIENSQGYPWLLKKLCIHVYNQLQTNQSVLVDTGLDVASLFDKDLSELPSNELACLRYIAKHAPAESGSVHDLFDPDLVRRLVDRRLIVRSGDRLNIYWDIFQEYILTGQVPHIPLTYLPTTTSITTCLNLTDRLDTREWLSPQELVKVLSVVEKTMLNIIRDLVMFGVVERSNRGLRLEQDLENNEPKAILQQIRRVLKRHALFLRFSEIRKGAVIERSIVVELLRQILPTASHRQKTWEIYADRMLIWLSITGLITQQKTGTFINTDTGKVLIGSLSERKKRQGRQESEVFLGKASPEQTVKVLSAISNSEENESDLSAREFQNAISVLKKLKLVNTEEGSCKVTIIDIEMTTIEVVWSAARKHPTLKLVCQWLSENPDLKRKQIGERLNLELQRGWKKTSQIRNGGAIGRWARWLNSGTQETPAAFPKRSKKI